MKTTILIAALLSFGLFATGQQPNPNTIERLQLFKAYPNPVQVNEDITINFSDPNITEATLMIASDAGQIVFSQQISFTSSDKKEISIETKGFAKGFYLIMANELGRMHQQMIIVK